MSNLLVSVVVPITLGLFTLAGVLLLHRRELIKQRSETTTKAEDRTLAAAQETVQTALSERGLERRVEMLDQRYDTLQRQVHDEAKGSAQFREHVAREYMTRSEFVESQARIERKIDSIGVTLLDLARQRGGNQTQA